MSFSLSFQTNKLLLKFQVAAPMLSHWILVRPFLRPQKSGSSTIGLMSIIVIPLDWGFGWRYCSLLCTKALDVHGRASEGGLWIRQLDVSVNTHGDRSAHAHNQKWFLRDFSKSCWWMWYFMPTMAAPVDTHCTRQFVMTSQSSFPLVATFKYVPCHYDDERLSLFTSVLA